MIDEKKETIDEPVHESQELSGNEVPSGSTTEQLEEPIAEKKKRSKWMTAGIVLLIVIGIPLLLAGTCMLIIRLIN